MESAMVHGANAQQRETTEKKKLIFADLGRFSNNAPSLSLSLSLSALHV